MMLLDQVNSMGRNLVGIWVRGGGLLSGFLGWMVSIPGSMVGATGLAYSSPVPFETMSTSMLAQRVPMPRLDRPILRVGSQGEAVTELQGMLKLLGYYSGVVNGLYDSTTSQAVSRFQQVAGLSADGIVGTDTWNRLLPPTATPIEVEAVTPCACNVPSTGVTLSSGDLPILQFGLRGTAVVMLQQRLQAQGFFSGIVDGIFGSDTEEAVRRAQQSYSLSPNGVVDARLWEILLR